MHKKQDAVDEVGVLGISFPFPACLEARVALSQPKRC